MKIHYILMFQFILALFGCKKSPESGETTQQVGPFTIETVTSTGHRWNSNYGRTKYTHIGYNVKFNGEPLSFSEGLEQNTGVPGIWRVFWFKDAASPTLLIGSQSLFLVTVNGDKPDLRPLKVQYSDFASIQWLDSENGQPGWYRELYGSDMYDRESELQGGRYMAISQYLVLDTKTLETFVFNPNNDEIGGYYKSGAGAVAFSPDSNQVVYYGSKNHETDYNISHHGLICYNFRTREHYAVNFDPIETYIIDKFAFPMGWVDEHFTWNKTDSGGYRLELNAEQDTVTQKGTLFHRRNQGFIYTIRPAEESLMPVLAEYIRKELGLSPDKVTVSKEPYANRIILDAPGKKLVLQYGEYDNDLVLRDEALQEFTEEHKQLMLKLGRGFNEYLKK